MNDRKAPSKERPNDRPFVKAIESRSNPIFRELKSLLESSGLKKSQKFIASGRKIVPELLTQTDPTARSPQFEAVITFEGAPEAPVHRLQTLLLKKELFDELDILGTHFPLLVGQTKPIPTENLETPPVGLELVLALSDPLNLGAALRSAEAFEVSKVILLSECAHPFLPKVLRASSASALRTPLFFGPSIRALTPAAIKTLWALDRAEGDGATPLSEIKGQKNVRLLIGQEGQGLPEEIPADQKISIEMKAGMDSLNAVAAASIALYTLRTRGLKA
jgi:tRNA G18 (ribose-2'-O)-methylase SpoU